MPQKASTRLRCFRGIESKESIGSVQSDPIDPIDSTDPKELSSISEYSFLGLGIQHHPEYYIPYVDKRQLAIEASRPLSDLKPELQDKKRLEEYLKQPPRNTDKLRFLPITTEHKPLTAVIDSSSEDLVDILDIKPGVEKH